MEKKEKFIKKISEIFSVNSGDVLTALNSKPFKSFWININHYKEEVVLSELKEQGFEIKKSEIPKMFVMLNKQDEISKTEAFIENKIYIQHLSSSIPVQILDPKANENILDLSAAPGSKTSLMNIYALNKANITAVEVNKNRFFRLKQTLLDYKIENVNCLLADGKTLVKRNPEFKDYFDKVLVDAPCSNEAGICLTDELSFNFWNPGKGKSLSGLQKSLLASGFEMLKPNGKLVYSTCTFSVEENEMVIDWLLKKFENAKLEKIELSKEIPFIDGKIDWRRKQFHSTLLNTKRILPNEYFEGFYVALITKLSERRDSLPAGRQGTHFIVK